MAKEKKYAVCIGTFTDGTERFARKKVDELKATGYKNAKVIPSGKYIRVTTGDDLADQEAAKAAVDEMAQKGIEAFVLNL